MKDLRADCVTVGGFRAAATVGAIDGVLVSVWRKVSDLKQSSFQTAASLWSVCV